MSSDGRCRCGTAGEGGGLGGEGSVWVGHGGPGGAWQSAGDYRRREDEGGREIEGSWRGVRSGRL